jgi:hypothetical protein
MTLKARVAKFIQSEPKARYQKWVEFQKKVPEIRLKKGARNQVLINLSAKDGWSDPETWLNNYVASQKVNTTRAISQLFDVITAKELVQMLREVGLPIPEEVDKEQLIREAKDQEFQCNLADIEEELCTMYNSWRDRYPDRDLSQLAIPPWKLYRRILNSQWGISFNDEEVLKRLGLSEE